MKRFLIPGLVIVHLLLHALAVWAAMEQWYQSSPEGRLGVFLPLAVSTLGPSQGALLAVWIALGRRGIPWRVALAAIGTVVYLGCFHNADSEWLGTTVGEMGFMVALLLCARLTGLELTHVAQQSTVRPRFQFFIRDILAWTTALAVVMSAGQFLALHKWCPGFPSPVGESFAGFWNFVVSRHGFVVGLARPKVVYCACRPAAGGGWCGRSSFCRHFSATVLVLHHAARSHGRLDNRLALGGPLGRIPAELALAVQPPGGRVKGFHAAARSRKTTGRPRAAHAPCREIVTRRATGTGEIVTRRVTGTGAGVTRPVTGTGEIVTRRVTDTGAGVTRRVTGTF